VSNHPDDSGGMKAGPRGRGVGQELSLTAERREKRTFGYPKVFLRPTREGVLGA
jgi:hypothetical protein